MASRWLAVNRRLVKQENRVAAEHSSAMNKAFKAAQRIEPIGDAKVWGESDTLSTARAERDQAQRSARLMSRFARWLNGGPWSYSQGALNLLLEEYKIEAVSALADVLKGRN